MTPDERREHCRRIASKGGKATASKPGHMSEIGKKGFKGLCRKFPGNSRRYALHFLAKGGAMIPRYVPRQSTEQDGAVYEAMMAEMMEEPPF